MQWYVLALSPNPSRPSVGMAEDQTGVSRLRLRPMRRLRHWFWMRKGSRAFDAEEWEIASRCYRRAVRAQPDDPLAWEHRILAVLRMGHDKAADRLIDEAKKMVRFDDEGLIVMQLYSAWLKGDTEIVHGYLGDLAEVDIHLARATAYHLMIDTQGLDLPLGPGSSDDRYARIDGYA